MSYILTIYITSVLLFSLPCVYDRIADETFGAVQVGQSEGRQAADTESLMFPGQEVLGQVYLLVDDLELQLLTELSDCRLHVLGERG